MPSAKKRDVSELFRKKNKGVHLDIGCGANKQGPDWVGIDYREIPGVDIVHDLTMFPWPIPDESVSLAVASHVVEHLNPMPVDPRITALVDLLLKKKVFSEKEKDAYIGEHAPGPIFMRFMDEVWRIMKPGGEFMVSLPYAGSPGFYQDPTHINNCSEVTWDYFDPSGPYSGGSLWTIYQPKPWKVKVNTWHMNGNSEIVLIKRPLKEEKK